MKPFEYEIGQRVRTKDGIEGHIARKSKVFLLHGWAFSYSIIEANGDHVGNGRLIHVGTDSVIPIGGPGPKAIFDDGSRQSLIPGMELLVSDKAKKRQRAA